MGSCDAAAYWIKLPFVLHGQAGEIHHFQFSLDETNLRGNYQDRGQNSTGGSLLAIVLPQALMAVYVYIAVLTALRQPWLCCLWTAGCLF